MSITHITDGMLYPIVSLPVISAPDDPQAISETPPAAPGGGRATPATALQTPTVPLQAQATGPAAPAPPCGTTGEDPTITPPAVPEAPVASEVSGSEAPAVPKCPEGSSS